MRRHHRSNVCATAAKPALPRKDGLHRRRARYGKPRNVDPRTSARRRPRRAYGAVVRACGSIACAVHRAATHRCRASASSRDVPSKGLRHGKCLAPAHRWSADNRHGNHTLDGEHSAGRIATRRRSDASANDRSDTHRRGAGRNSMPAHRLSCARDAGVAIRRPRLLADERVGSKYRGSVAYSTSRYCGLRLRAANCPNRAGSHELCRR